MEHLEQATKNVMAWPKWKKEAAGVSESTETAGYVIGVDYATKPDRCFVTCMKCKKSIEVLNGMLPENGWCGCEHAEQKHT